MNLFGAYFDESGCHDGSRVLAVGGYLIRADRAARMERKWKAALKRYGLPYFHMVECAHGSGAFALLSKTSRIRVQTRMIELIKKHTALGFVTIVNPKRFEQVEPLPDPYTFSVNACLMGICAWFTDKPDSEIDFVFEAGHRNGKKADQHLMQHKNSRDEDISRYYRSHRFANKHDACLLQAADLLVWQSAKFMRDKVSKSRGPRADFISLIQHPTVFGYVVVHNGTLALSVDNSPEFAQSDRDEYIRAMFSDAACDNQVLDEYHKRFGGKQASPTSRVS
jgi:hypothetical protein